MIYTTSSPLSYTNTRSVYTPQERLEQTRKSVQSIREKIPDARVVIIEGSKLNIEEQKSLSADEIYFIKDSTDAQISPAKGRAEVMMIYEYLTLFPPAEEHIFKLSGRYWLDDRFDKDIYLLPQDICQKKGSNFGTTVLYKIYRDNLPLFLSNCVRTIQDPAVMAGIVGIENSLLIYGTFINIPILGVSGHVSIDGNFYQG